MNQQLTANSAVVSRSETVDDVEFLRNLGKGVRALREQRGLARKVLARDADVSERYLAQLEAGSGNISIMLLRRVALALGTSLSELFREDDLAQDAVFRLVQDFGTAETVRKKRIALIGMRGAGKSTLGAMLAARAGVPYVELDRDIENEAGISLGEIFMLYGQSGYRRLERLCLERVIRTRSQVVISVGGGIVSEIESYNLLLANCFTVWIRTTPEAHMSRVAAQGDMRPMQDNAEALEDLRQILTAREPMYAKADASIDTSGKTPEISLHELRRVVDI